MAVDIMRDIYFIDRNLFRSLLSGPRNSYQVHRSECFCPQNHLIIRIHKSLFVTINAINTVVGLDSLRLARLSSQWLAKEDNKRHYPFRSQYDSPVKNSMFADEYILTSQKKSQIYLDFS